MRTIVAIVCLAVLPHLHASNSAPDASNLAHFEKMAQEGDVGAMTELGLRYHQGRGVKQDYTLAYDWYMKAIELGDGDAFNNLAVLHRDGLGVPANRKVAYVLFLAIHMEGLGDESTQIRAGRNLERLANELSKPDLYEALSYTWPYVVQVITTRGKNLKAGPDVLPSEDRPRIRDNAWWLDSERAAMTFESPSPWNQAPQPKGKPGPKK